MMQKQQQHEKPSHGVPRAAGSRRVLVVDDDPESCALLAELLSWEGFQPSACTTGERALELLRLAHYDALVTDQIMPGISGVDLARRALDIDSSLRCVVLSGYARPEGINLPWIRKPINTEALIEMLTGLVS
jgi:CheY-like chemotaxis protein